MLNNFEIKIHYCDCHPETCCCPPYELLYDGVVLVRGDDVKLNNILLNAEIETLKAHLRRINKKENDKKIIN